MQRGIQQTVERVPGATPLALAPTPRADAPDWRAAAGLVARVAAGDEGALSALYDAYAPMLYTVALRIVRAEADAEEVVLETFTQAWQRAASYDGARGSVFAWLVTICRTRALDLLRGRTRSARALERATTSEDAPPALAAWHPDPAADLDRRDRYGRLAAAVHALPPSIRQVVELVLTESLTHTELAERLDIPLGTVKTRMRSGLQLLRGALGASLLD
ncbi:RNA polymerase sigma factor [Gemmatirosa kalamazoonensis]|nr:sigma-70 family RNA polymerase sigma factor [Gemmatirosa kalamazoonensis]